MRGEVGRLLGGRCVRVQTSEARVGTHAPRPSAPRVHENRRREPSERGVPMSAGDTSVRQDPAVGGRRRKTLGQRMAAEDRKTKDDSGRQQDGGCRGKLQEN